MSKFVDYKKRSIALPAGCKDLSDLLKAHVLPSAGNATPTIYRPPVFERKESMAGKISDIEKYIGMVFAMPTGTVTFVVNPSDGGFSINVFRMDARGIDAHVRVRGGTDQEKAVRLFFVQRGLEVPRESGMPEPFHPGIPWETCFDISPLPTEAALLSKFVTDLLREVFRLNDSSELQLHYVETREAAQPVESQ